MGRRRAPVTREDWVPELGILPESEAWQKLSGKYKLPLDDELLALLTGVRERHSRERGQGWSGKKFIVEREAAKSDLQALISQAAELEKRAAEIHKTITRFADAYEYDPNVMQAIAHVGPGTDFCAAEELHCLAAVSRLTAREAELREQLHAIVSLPIRDKLKRARVPHITLQRCVDDCKRYWRAQNRTPSEGTLGLAETQEGNRLTDLTEDFERFVSDVLQVTGVKHTLSQLSTAVARRLPRASRPGTRARLVKGTKQPRK